MLSKRIKQILNDIVNIKRYLSNLNRKTFWLFLTFPIKMRRIILYGKGRFYIEDGRLLLEVTHIRLGKKFVFAVNKNDFYQIEGIFVVPTDFLFYDNRNSYVVLDIGMNIGDTALLFSSYENVEKVYAFEPFKPTYQMAMRNFALNKEFAKKIVPYDFGISDCDKNITLNYSMEGTPGMTTYDNEINRMKNSVQETIVVKSIEYVFDNILFLSKENGEKHNHKLCIKIDCEGDEFEIFNKMDEKDLFKYVDIIMLEWHSRDFKILLDILEKHHFISFSLLNAPDSSHGNLFCFREK